MEHTSEPASEGTPGDELPDSDPRDTRGFTPEVLDKTVIAVPLLRTMKPWLDKWKFEGSKPEEARDYNPPILDVMIDVNLAYERGRNGAVEDLGELIEVALQIGVNKAGQGVDPISPMKSQYVVAQLEPHVISKLVELDEQQAQHSPSKRLIFRIWPDFAVSKLTYKSVSTVKADAARISFSAFGENVVWAVVDSGIDEHHPHFIKYQNLKLQKPLDHWNFTKSGTALSDEFGHGTHVAGIIAGGLFKGDHVKLKLGKETATVEEAAVVNAAAPVAASLEKSAAVKETTKPARARIRAAAKRRDQEGEVTYDALSLSSITGMAPKCKLVSLKVLDANGQGKVSQIIAALEQIQQLNAYGRNIQIHGVNLSVGYEFEPEWFACGQSPLCVEVDLLARSGVVVVVAAGNTGYGFNNDKFKGMVSAGLDLTINDPGNAERAITVGSTHRESPHTYGVSYFSSKGPTGDGRLKPDVVAPGEKILSCAAGEARRKAEGKFKQACDYVEDSGTSMAAPHVSGVIAAFLSVRSEFIGKTEEIKDIFLSSATDLKRDRNFQGHGIVDLMRAIQSV
ncbi:S8 family peptidase [Pseudarthrobacter sp. YS3]|uniref:S8 family peptidase n=1 Tax=Pseudarthrobacter sp. YS3 TaxID=3453718 RepID=UPI003EE9DAAB